MNQKMKRTLRVLTCTMLTLLLVSGAGSMLVNINVRSHLTRIEEFHDLEPRTIDVMAYGSSVCQKGVNPVIWSEEYGISGYNYAQSWQHPNTIRLFIKDSFRTQSPKVVLIETYTLDCIMEDRNLNAEILYTKGLKIPLADRLAYLHQCFGNDPERWSSYALPIIQLHEDWVSLKPDDLWLPPGEDPLQRRGFAGNSSVYPITITDEEVEVPFPADCKALLNEMIDICEANGAEVVLFTIPIEGKQYAYEKELQQLADDRGCAYLNFYRLMEETGLDTQTDWYDTGHINVSGAEKVTRYLGRYLAEHYDVQTLHS